jgi:hypothetical protein
VIETLGIPTVTLCTQPFRTLSTARKNSLGLPDLQIVYLPHPMMTRSPAEIEKLADEVFAEVKKDLTEATP